MQTYCAHYSDVLDRPCGSSSDIPRGCRIFAVDNFTSM